VPLTGRRVAVSGRAVRTCVRDESGHAYARFRRALLAKTVNLIAAAARELQQRLENGSAKPKSPLGRGVDEVPETGLELVTFGL
jgi:hypothetical protein